MTHKNDFLRKGPAGLVVVPLLFALVTLALLAVMFKVFAAPYYSLVEWFMETSVVETQPKDLFDEAAQTLTNTENDRTAQEEPEQEAIPLSSITYPARGTAMAALRLRAPRWMRRCITVTPTAS